MADFCLQASMELFGRDCGDLANLCKPGKTVEVLCEDCGVSWVDPEGKCLGGQMCDHGKEPA